MESLNGDTHYEHAPETLTHAISEPIFDMLDRGGKRWRSVLVMLIGEALGGNYDIYSDLVAVSEIVHNGTLAIDDIEDSSEFRRGKKAMHLLFGIDIAVNAGNAMYFLPLQVLKAKASLLPAETILKLYEIYSQEMINLHFGQVALF